jgi:hypothetical protein
MSNNRNVKTTIDISDNLLNRARELAAKEKTTLKELAEEGLELVLSRHGHGAAVRIRPVIVQGKGLSPDLKGKSWGDIRDEIYRGAGS